MVTFRGPNRSRVQVHEMVPMNSPSENMAVYNEIQVEAIDRRLVTGSTADVVVTQICFSKRHLDYP
jgi:hypothetical protein